MKRDVESLQEVPLDPPLRWGIAAPLAYPDGSMTASGLRKEAARGRLAIERVAGKDYTTLAAIERMRELCRAGGGGRASGTNQAATTETATPTLAAGRSATEELKRRLGLGPDTDQSALDAALEDYLKAKRKIPRDRD